MVYEQERTVTPEQVPDTASILALSDTRSVIDSIYEDLCGLSKIKRGDNYVMVRTSKPRFTYEFAKDIVSQIFIESNRITSRTHYDAERLEAFYRLQSDTLKDFFTVHGFKNYITEEVWDKILQLATEDKKDGKYTIETEKGDVITKYRNKWYTMHNIYWDYNQPVNSDMVRIVKKIYDLEGEEVGQSTAMRTIFWSIRIFLEGGLNKSLNHLSLDHEKVTHSERVFQSDHDSNKQSEGFMRSTINNIKNLVGGK